MSMNSDIRAVDTGPFPNPGTFLKPERIQELLLALPGWRLAKEGKAIERTWTMPSGQVAALFGAYVSTYGKALGLEVVLGLGDRLARVTLSQQVGCETGLTESVFELARVIG